MQLIALFILNTSTCNQSHIDHDDSQVINISVCALNIACNVQYVIWSQFRGDKLLDTLMLDYLTQSSSNCIEDIRLESEMVRRCTTSVFLDSPLRLLSESMFLYFKDTVALDRETTEDIFRCIGWQYLLKQALFTLIPFLDLWMKTQALASSVLNPAL